MRYTINKRVAAALFVASAFCASIMSLLCANSSSQAGTIFSSFGPGPTTYDCCDAWNVFGGTATPYFQETAMSFTATSASQLTQIDVALSFISGTNSVVLSLNSDVGGLPGAVVQSWTLTGLPGFGGCCAIETVTTNMLLSGGTPYWLVAAPGAANTEAGWNFNNIGLTGLVAVDNAGPWFYPPHNELAAFDVLGNTTAAVPEPSSFLLLISAALIGILFKPSRTRPLS